jgi:competence protein ComEA
VSGTLDCREWRDFMSDLLKKFSSDKKNYKYAAMLTFILAAGVIYSVFRLLDGGGSTVHEYSVSQTTAVAAEAVTEAETKGKTIFVHVSGAVANPNVYEVSEGIRLYELIELAGGCVEGADADAVNLADKIADGQKVYIPMVGEDVTVAGNSGTSSTTEKININTATESELTALPGIGASRARDIVSYRTKNGFFATIEDIKNVSGIKDAAFEKIKDYIKV